ncbi:hypothetical protein HAX54_025795, partial [Datura stramonium]|nr:hypothetical protein [Datura stramonium]
TKKLHRVETDPNVMLRAEDFFRDSISPPSKSQYLIILDHKDNKDETKLSVDTLLAGQYAAPWSSLGSLSCLDDWTLEYNSRPPKTWSDTFTLDGEFHYVPGYWEWAEDILSKSAKTWKASKVYYAVYGLLFTYDRNQTSCKPFANLGVLLRIRNTSTGEISISLWNLQAIGGLPIEGSLYEEIVSNVAELTGTYDRGWGRFLPQACENLFDTFHRLREGDRNNLNVPVRKWIIFWCKKAIKYQ